MNCIRVIRNQREQYLLCYTPNILYICILSMYGFTNPNIKILRLCTYTHTLVQYYNVYAEDRTFFFIYFCTILFYAVRVIGFFSLKIFKQCMYVRGNGTYLYCAIMFGNGQEVSLIFIFTSYETFIMLIIIVYMSNIFGIFAYKV